MALAPGGMTHLPKIDPAPFALSASDNVKSTFQFLALESMSLNSQKMQRIHDLQDAPYSTLQQVEFQRTFINSLATITMGFYYQAYKDASVIRSGVDMLGLSLTLAITIVVAGIWGVAIDAVILQNELGRRISPSTLELLGADIHVGTTYSIIPDIGFLQPPIKTEIQHAFSQALAVVSLVGVLVIGWIVSLAMPGLELQNRIDE
ncbi:hypothetical protein C8J56DRAFT_892897 [Mycena floridula]|nr:hypothetical protein C8J56DRAFT_892897 [Mycena floridula]